VVFPCLFVCFRKVETLSVLVAPSMLSDLLLGREREREREREFIGANIKQFHTN